MSLIFEALQKLDRRRAGTDSHPKLEAADLSLRSEQKTTPRWETGPEESTGEVPLSEYSQPVRFLDTVLAEPPHFADPVFAEPSFASPVLSEPALAGPALVDPVPAVPVPVIQAPSGGLAAEIHAPKDLPFSIQPPASHEPAEAAAAEPAPAELAADEPAPTVAIPAAPGPELASRAPASPVPAGLTVTEAPFQFPNPPSRVVAPNPPPPQPAAPVQAYSAAPTPVPAPAPARASAPVPAPAPARPKQGLDLTPVVERLAGLYSQQRELRELGSERKAALARLGDHLDDVRNSSDRNTREQSELFKELRGIGRRINFLAVAGLLLTAASLALSCALYLRFLNVIH